jgi:hypothetical protein
MVAWAAIVGKPWVGGTLDVAISDAARSALSRLSRRGAPLGVKRSPVATKGQSPQIWGRGDVAEIVPTCKLGTISGTEPQSEDAP